MDIITAINGRQSVRHYSPEPLSAEEQAELIELAHQLVPLYPDIPIRVHLATDGEAIQSIMSGIIGSYGKVKAPHYLVVSSTMEEGYLENVGFALEPLVLQLTTMGLGTCWIGGHVKKDLLRGIVNMQARQEPVVLISVGRPAAGVELLRPAEKAKRKPLQELVLGHVTGEWGALLEAAQMAPSAVNSQPWRFVVDGSAIHLYIAGGFLAKKFLATMNRIDAGIALSHLKLAAFHYGRTLSIRNLQKADFKGMTYIASALFE